MPRMEDLHDGASQPAYHDNICARLRSLRFRLDQGQSARSHYRFGEWWEVSNRRRAFRRSAKCTALERMGVDSSQHRFQPSIMAQLAPDDVPRLKVKWAFGYAGAVRAFAQPTIVAGRLFVGSQSGKVSWHPLKAAIEIVIGAAACA